MKRQPVFVVWFGAQKFHSNSFFMFLALIFSDPYPQDYYEILVFFYAFIFLIV